MSWVLRSGRCVGLGAFVLAVLLAMEARGQAAPPDASRPETPEVVAAAAAKYAALGYTLTWSDEFNVDGRPDPDHWSYEHGFVRNDELQYYREENAWVQGGRLIIEARREQVDNARHDPGSRDWRRSREHAQYTSALIRSRDKVEFLYGRLEVRAKIVAQPGLWPAIWTLGSARRWPGCGEVDVMEYYDDSLLANAAWYAWPEGEGDGEQGRPRRKVKWDAVKVPMREIGGADWDQHYHVWRMDWDEDLIRLYVDDVLINEIDLSKTINDDAEAANPFHEPHFILLNLAIGGTQGGDPRQTDFPSRFEVDYVRMYQKAK